MLLDTPSKIVGVIVIIVGIILYALNLLIEYLKYRKDTKPFRDDIYGILEKEDKEEK